MTLPIMTADHHHLRKRVDMPRTLLTAASSAGTAALLLFAVSACGGGSTPSSTTPTSGAQPTQSAAAGGSAPGQGFPGASGKVAAISGKTLQVQSVLSGQVAVTYTTKTKFTEAVKTTASALKVGSCVSVRGPDEQAGTAATAGPVTAVSVQLSPPVNGACGARGLAGAGDGLGRNGGGFTPPTGRPTGAPGGGAGAGGGTRGGGFAGARPVSGEVTAVSGSTITVAQVSFGGARAGVAAGGATASPSAKPTTTPVVVTTTAATTYTKTVSATAKDLAVGLCVTAVGTANDTGAVAASFIASQPAVNGECTGGFGGRRTGTGGTS
jgi:Domain of unknown function (DUF5666)